MHQKKVRGKGFQYWVVSILTVLFFIGTSSTGAADSLDTFDVQIKLPESQRDKELMYYDLLLEPKAEEKLAVMVSNKSEQPINLQLSFNRAVTNMTGVVEYSGANEEATPSAPYAIEELVTLSDETLSLAPNEQKEITLTVQMPSESFDGILAGGLYVQQTGSEEFQGNVQNLLAREVAVLLRNKETDIPPAVRIEEAHLEEINRRNVIIVAVENTAANYLSKATLAYEVFHDGQATAIKGEKEIQLAPNALMNYALPLDGNELQSGENEIKTTLKAADQQWQGEPTFQVESQEAQERNEQDFSIEETASPILLYLSIGGVLCLIIAYLIWHNRKLKRALKKTDDKTP